MKHYALLAIGTALLAGSPGWAHQATPGHAHHATPAIQEQQDWGIAGEAKDVQRTIMLTMSDDMRFTPSRIEVRQGETVRLRVRNSGKLMHELVLGTPRGLAAHAEMMMKHPGMEHDEPWMAHVAPGMTGDIVWTFNRAGEFEFACLIAGHFQAGMKGTIRVVANGTGHATPAATPRPSLQDMPHSHMGHMQDGAMHSGGTTPYAGQQQREIKALSTQDMQAYVQGQGHGFAKAAELNGYPGPMHVLELADALQLSAEQREQSQALLARHKATAQRLGADLIEAERTLDQAFASRSVTAQTLAQLTQAAGEKLAQLRTEHLQTHLAQTALLTPEQVARYNSLRGYGSQPAMPHQHMHQPEMTHEQHRH